MLVCLGRRECNCIDQDVHKLPRTSVTIQVLLYIHDLIATADFVCATFVCKLLSYAFNGTGRSPAHGSSV